MNENELPNERISSRVRANEFLRRKTRFWGGSRRQAIQLLAAGAGAAATLALSAFAQGKAAIAAEAGAKQGKKQEASNRLEPNLFELQGYNTRIVYSTSSIAGVPQLSYFSREQERTFSGEEIQVEETAFGKSVTVFLTTGAADEPIESVTLLLPAIQLSSQVKELPIQTVAILSIRAAFVNPNAPLQLQTYDTISLFGVARQVQF
jgi:hypothetical protein